MKHFINFALLLFVPAFLNSNFHTQANLQQPTLIESEKSQNFVETPMEFKWNKVIDAEYYEIEVSKDVTFMNFNFKYDISRDFIQDTVYKPLKIQFFLKNKNIDF